MKFTRKQLSDKYNISKNQWIRRKDDLLEHLSEFMDITEIEPSNNNMAYLYEIKGEIPETIPPLPRKNTQTTKQKEKDYVEFVKAHLPKDWEPESKVRMAREAILDFGNSKYNHYSTEAVVRRYVGPAMEEYGEKTDEMYWVDCYTYRIVSDELLADWHQILHQYRINEKQMAEAFIKYSEGEDISKEVSSYKQAQEHFYNKYGIRIIKVNKWKVKDL